MRICAVNAQFGSLGLPTVASSLGFGIYSRKHVYITFADNFLLRRAQFLLPIGRSRLPQQTQAVSAVPRFSRLIGAPASEAHTLH